MKLSFLLLLLSQFLFCKSDNMITNWTEPIFTGFTDAPIKVNSMVWVGKHYKYYGTEIRDFFFAVPFQFDTRMTVFTTTKSIHLNFQNFDNAVEMFRVFREEGQKAKESRFGKLLTFSDDFTDVEINLNFDDTEFSFSHVHKYENQFSMSIQIKITIPDSIFGPAFYITFDLAKGDVNPEIISSFIEFLNKLKK
jgi:hypothetical protein